MEPLKIGISARLLYPDPRRFFLPTKTVQYLEQSVANWVMSGEVLAFMIPEMSLASPHLPRTLRVKDYVDQLDGLVLQGGADIAPETYGESPLNPEWSGDRIRDPGTVDTPSFADRTNALADPEQGRKDFIARQPMGRLGTAGEVAELCVYLASEESAFMTGQAIALDGGWTI